VYIPSFENSAGNAEASHGKVKAGETKKPRTPSLHRGPEQKNRYDEPRQRKTTMNSSRYTAHPTNPAHNPPKKNTITASPTSAQNGQGDEQAQNHADQHEVGIRPHAPQRPPPRSAGVPERGQQAERNVVEKPTFAHPVQKEEGQRSRKHEQRKEQPGRILIGHREQPNDRQREEENVSEQPAVKHVEGEGDAGQKGINAHDGPGQPADDLEAPQAVQKLPLQQLGAGEGDEDEQNHRDGHSPSAPPQQNHDGKKQTRSTILNESPRMREDHGGAEDQGEKQRQCAAPPEGPEQKPQRGENEGQGEHVRQEVRVHADGQLHTRRREKSRPGRRPPIPEDLARQEEDRQGQYGIQQSGHEPDQGRGLDAEQPLEAIDHQ